VLAFIYTTLQLVRHGVRLTGGQDLQGKVAVLVDFAGDQVSAARRTPRLCVPRLHSSCCPLFN
jgi:hypothetical protein